MVSELINTHSLICMLFVTDDYCLNWPAAAVLVSPYLYFIEINELQIYIVFIQLIHHWSEIRFQQILNQKSSIERQELEWTAKTFSEVKTV